jgi:hypothetical protein
LNPLFFCFLQFLNKGCFRKVGCFWKSLVLMVKIAVDFHERLRFPRGDCGASSRKASSRSGNPRIITQNNNLYENCQYKKEATKSIDELPLSLFFNQA